MPVGMGFSKQSKECQSCYSIIRNALGLSFKHLVREHILISVYKIFYLHSSVS